MPHFRMAGFHPEVDGFYVEFNSLLIVIKGEKNVRHQHR